MSSPVLRRLPAVLVIDDELRSQEALRRTLEEDFEVFCASGAAEGMEILEMEQSTAGIRVILCDQRMPGTTGVQFLKEVRQRWPDIVRIILSGYTDAEDIISGVNEAGIWQYLLKPWQPEQLLLTLQRAAEVWRLQQENQRLSLDLRTAEPVLRRRVDSKQDKARKVFGLAALVRGPVSPLDPVCDLVGRIAPYDLSVMVTGESGTGKEMIARAIHYESNRADKPFITENCGAVPDTLLESELFGYKRGAFTGAVDDRIGLFQQADGGTLFLDEIGDMPADTQTRLLRVLADGEFYRVGGHTPVRVDVRIIAATHQDLETLVQAGKFREDLFHRLNVIRIHIPRLADRREDIPALAEHFLASAAQELSVETKVLKPETKEYLQHLPWPGNVRQLENTCRWITVMASGREVHVDDLPPELLNQQAEAQPAHNWEQALRNWSDQALARGQSNLLDEAVPAFERIMIETALKHTAGRRRDAALLLGWGRNTLTRKIKELGMRVDGSDDDDGDDS